MEGLTGAERSTSPTEPDDHVIKEPARSISPEEKCAQKKENAFDAEKGRQQTRGPNGIQGMRDGSPWDSYWKSFQVKYTDFVTVAVRKGGRRKCVIVKSFSAGADSQQELEMIHGIRHDNIVTVLETFRFEGSFHVVLERIPIPLVQIIASPAYPGEQELAAILGLVNEADMRHEYVLTVVDT